MNRKSFLKAIGIAGLAAAVPIQTYSKILFEKSSAVVQEFVKRVRQIMNSLNRENSNIVMKVLNGRKYVIDPFTHYPQEGGITDENTNCTLFFHAHRENEYGHFHTFIRNRQGDLIHLVMISMNEKGEPFSLSTVNRWVTGDKYVKAEQLKKYFDRFEINSSLFRDKRLIEFVSYIFKAYREKIYDLFDERDKWIRNYAGTYYREPFEDQDFEVLSSMKIDVYRDA